MWSSGKGQARIGKGWPSRRKATKLKPLLRAYTKVGCWYIRSGYHVETLSNWTFSVTWNAPSAMMCMSEISGFIWRLAVDTQLAQVWQKSFTQFWLLAGDGIRWLEVESFIIGSVGWCRCPTKLAYLTYQSELVLSDVPASEPRWRWVIQHGPTHYKHLQGVQKTIDTLIFLVCRYCTIAEWKHLNRNICVDVQGHRDPLHQQPGAGLGL